MITTTTQHHSKSTSNQHEQENKPNNNNNDQNSFLLSSTTNTLIKSTISDLRFQLNYSNYKFNNINNNNDKSTTMTNLLNMGKSSISSLLTSPNPNAALMSNTKYLFKSTPSLTPSSETSSSLTFEKDNSKENNNNNKYTNKNIDFFGYEFIPIKQNNNNNNNLLDQTSNQNLLNQNDFHFNSTSNLASKQKQNEQQQQFLQDTLTSLNHTRELFTPDSLESSISSCLTDSDEDKDSSSLNQQDTSLNQLKSAKTDSGLSVSPQLTQSSSSSSSCSKQANETNLNDDLEVDFETDEEICQITINKSNKTNSENELTESSLILEKINKINKLQEKINDINNKIKSIDMNGNIASSESKNNNNNKNYYCLHQDILDSMKLDLNELDETQTNNQPQSDDSEDTNSDGICFYINPKYCEDDEEEENSYINKNVSKQFNKEFKKSITNRINQLNENSNCLYRNRMEEADADQEDNEFEESDFYLDKSKNQNYRNRNNQTRLGLRSSQESDSDEDGEIQNQNNDDLTDGYYQDENDSNQDDDDDEDFLLSNEHITYKQAQPVHKKFASTGFLFHRFGAYLAPIEEGPEDSLQTANSNHEECRSSSPQTSDLSSSNSNLIEESTTNQYNFSKKGSASCFNLDFKSFTNSSEINEMLLITQTNQNTPTTTTTSIENNISAFTNNIDDLVSSCYLDREEFVDNSSLNESDCLGFKGETNIQNEITQGDLITLRFLFSLILCL